ncbi:MAG TPA: MerR family transcriptional regulator [Clostridiales bacterium]|nr:MerR family transcriptional regulator [Clostridiales bacterium]HQP70533.1 MerR family transcriptional regulator [Clostridiales bacterium]
MDLIKERIYYTIGEVSTILNLNASTIRYWEKKFDLIKISKRNGASKRKYELKDIQVLFRIKTLLKDENNSIKKAKELMLNWKPSDDFETFKKAVEKSNQPEIKISKENFQKIKNIIADIRKLLKK